MISEPNCIFCKIVAGMIACEKVLETERALVFLDISPVNLGHVLIVPRSHHAHLGELDEADAAHVGSLLPKICRAVLSATGASAINVVINNGRDAGQTVDHGHWHVIPRFPADAVHWPWPHVAYPPEGPGPLRERIRSALASE